MSALSGHLRRSASFSGRCSSRPRPPPPPSSRSSSPPASRPRCASPRPRATSRGSSSSSREGRIRIVKDGLLLGGSFLDLSGRICSGGERGLLGLAFHPEYRRNGRFFVNYTDPQGNTVVSEFAGLVESRLRQRRERAGPPAPDAALLEPQRRAPRVLADRRDPVSRLRRRRERRRPAEPRAERRHLAREDPPDRRRRTGTRERSTPSRPTTRSRGGRTRCRRSGRRGSATRGASRSTGRSATSGSATSGRGRGRRSTGSPPRLRGARTTAGGGWRGRTATTRRPGARRRR